jgi:SHS2 domain-containing protein
MKKFELIETTADIGVVATGNSLREAFTNTASGLFSIMTETDKVEKRDALPFSAEGDNLENLLINWLNELIYLQEINDFFGKEVVIKEFVEKSLKGEIWGEKIDRNRHILGTEIKAVTYHNLEIRDKNGNWMIKVIFDI